MSVRRVLAEAHVGHQDELGEARPQRAQSELHDAVVLPRTGRLLVLLLRYAEEHHRLNAAADELFDLAHDVLDGEARHAGQRLVAKRFGRDEERHHERLEIEPRLAHESAQGAGAPEAPEPDVGEGAHLENSMPSAGYPPRAGRPGAALMVRPRPWASPAWRGQGRRRRPRRSVAPTSSARARFARRRTPTPRARRRGAAARR